MLLRDTNMPVPMQAQQGRTFDHVHLSEDEQGEPLAFPFASARFQVRRYDGAALALSLTTPAAGGITITGGELVLSATADQMDFTPGRYEYELVLFDAADEAGTSYTELSGPFILSPTVA